MKSILFLLFFLHVSISIAANKNNWRCWADPGFYGVVKIDTENMKVCSTGYDGQNYECTGSMRVLNLSSIEKTEMLIEGQKYSGIRFVAVSSDGQTTSSIVVLDQEFPRPYFPSFNVNPANFEINTGLLGYPSSTWTRKPDGLFPDGAFYCLSEKYFIQQLKRD